MYVCPKGSFYYLYDQARADGAGQPWEMPLSRLWRETTITHGLQAGKCSRSSLAPNPRREAWLRQPGWGPSKDEHGQGGPHPCLIFQRSVQDPCWAASDPGRQQVTAPLGEVDEVDLFVLHDEELVAREGGEGRDNVNVM